MTPRAALPDAACAEDATASAVAPPNISSAPPITPAQRRQSASRSSWKSTTPQKIPSRLLLFHSGNAIVSPTSRIAKIVSVLATAHSAPASTDHTMRCGACRKSARMCDVPWISAGRLQRARNTPNTMASDTTTGDRPIVTSFVGASAAPSHTPAASPQRMPSRWRRRSRAPSASAEGSASRGAAVIAVIGSTPAPRARRSARSRESRTAGRAGWSRSGRGGRRRRVVSWARQYSHRGPDGATWQTAAYSRP
jgi:hypothetical protein